MKIIFEEKDIKELRSMAKSFYGVELTDDQVSAISQQVQFVGNCYLYGMTDAEVRDLHLPKVLKKIGVI